jgi:hypothetical protein
MPGAPFDAKLKLRSSNVAGKSICYKNLIVEN